MTFSLEAICSQLTASRFSLYCTAAIARHPAAVDRLLETLTQYSAPNVFNPWRDDDPMDALPGGAERRIERLRAHFECEPVALLIGEAPGYQGCHFSGIPFTNEKLIMAGAVPRVSSVFRLTAREPAWSEPSATIVWGALRELGVAERAVLWNAFAWHPHKPGVPLSNRRPTPQEVRSGLPALKAVIAKFAGAPIVAVGRVAEATLAQLGIPIAATVRHPAMGGATEFRAGMNAFLRGRPHHR